MIRPVAVILIFAPLLAPSVALSRPASPCPDCLNGGLCLPSTERTRGANVINAKAAIRCFCRTPWTGEFCDRDSSLDDGAEGDGSEIRTSKVPVSLSRLRGETQMRKLESGPETKMHQVQSEAAVLLVNFALDATADPALKDVETMRFAVYSALCPSSPCPSGLVMEDITVLSLTEDSRHRMQVQLALSPPTSVEVVKAELEAQLQDANSNLRADAFGGLILHSGFQLADAQVLAPKADAQDAIAITDLRGSIETHKLSRQPTARPAEEAKAPNERFIPHRPDRSGSMSEGKSTSCATYCITISALVFLCFSVAHVSVERVSRWLYPDELEQPADAADLDEFQQEGPMQDQDFQLVRNLLEVMKHPLGPVVIYAILMYIVQARARELTRGFGDPPEWADTCMQVLTTTNLIFVVVMSIQALHLGTTVAHNKKAMIVNLFLYPSPAFLVAFAIVRVVELVTSAALLYCAWFMTTSDCNIDGALANGLWRGSTPPPLSLEHKMCLGFVLQYIFVFKLECIATAFHLAGILQARDPGTQIERKKDLEFDLSRHRVLVKTSNLAPLLAIITLAINEVPIQVEADRTFRHVCLHSVQVVMWGYTLFIYISTIVLPRGSRVEVGDVASGVVTLASNTDYIAQVGTGTRDRAWRHARRWFLLAGESIALVLATSVFFLQGKVGPAPVVPWPIMWTIFVMIQCIVVHLLLLAHEVFVAPFEDQAAGDQLLLLKSSIHEVEGFMALGPMLGLIFLNGHIRATLVMRTGEMPLWVLTAINSVAQTLLLQLVSSLAEATIAGLLFRKKRSWSNLKPLMRKPYEPQNLELGEAAVPRPSQDLTGFDTELAAGRADPEEDLPPPADLEELQARERAQAERAQAGQGIAIDEAARRVEEEGPTAPAGQSSWWPPKAEQIAERSNSRHSIVDQDYEMEFLATKFLNLFCTLFQVWLTVTLYISTFLVIIAIWTMDADMPRKTYAPGDWRSSLFPLLPVSAPTTTAMEVMVWFVAIFFAVKGSGGLLLTLRHMYGAVNWAVLSAFSKSNMLVDLTPLIALLCLMVQSRAASFHGINAAPSYVVQAHMVVIAVAVLLELLASIATPAFTSELTKAEDTARLIPGIRLVLFSIELMASLAMYWGLCVLFYGIAFMRPEDVVLSNGTTGVPWRGTGEVPPLPAIAWNMWGLCIFAFVVDFIHKVLHHVVARKRYKEGSARGDWFQRNKNLPVLRWLHAAVLARRTALGAVMLGALFIPLELLAHGGGSSGTLKEEEAISQSTIGFMKLLFFVISALLCVKTFLVFCFGCMETPTSHSIFKDNEVLYDQPSDTQPVVEYSASQGFRSSEETSNPFATSFRHLALGLTLCEAVAVAVLAGNVFVLLHQHSTMFSTGGILNGSMYLFALYLCVHSAWSFVVLLGYESTKLDALHDVVSSAPLILLLFMTCRQRALEVAGRHGIVPEWIQHLIFSCSMILFVEFAVVALAPSGRARGVHQQATRQTGGEVGVADLQATEQKEQQSVFWKRSTRVAYLFARTVLRLSMYSCLFPVVFGLFWMTEEQCSPKASAASLLIHHVSF